MQTAAIEFNTARPLTEQEAASIEKILSYDFSFMRDRLVKEGMRPAVVDTAVLEFRKYFILVRLSVGPLSMYSLDVDEVWHNFILHTRRYAAFCQDVFGCFIHHEPFSDPDYIEAMAQQDNAVVYPDFFEVYRAVFGPVPAIWSPTQKQDVQCSGMVQQQAEDGRCAGTTKACGSAPTLTDGSCAFCHGPGHHEASVKQHAHMDGSCAFCHGPGEAIVSQHAHEAGSCAFCHGPGDVVTSTRTATLQFITPAISTEPLVVTNRFVLN